MSDLLNAFHDLLRRDRRYRPDAYQFVWEALTFAQQELKMGTPRVTEPASRKERSAKPRRDRHVTGQELCEAARQYALRQYGMLAKIVLNSWGIFSTSDFGEIVYNLIAIGHMGKTPEDRREDFDNVYDFDTALEQEFRITLSES